jgi:hypothetical protein
MADGSEIADLTGYAVKAEDNTELYQLLERIDENDL